MPELLETLIHFSSVLDQAAPNIANRLQPGLSVAEIEVWIPEITAEGIPEIMGSWQVLVKLLAESSYF